MSERKTTVAHTWKTKILGYTGGISGGASVLGSYQLCHSICLGIISLLSIIGITVVGMPLMFLNTISVPVWIFAVVLLGITGLLTLRHTCMSRKLLLANIGLIVAGTPFRAMQQYQSLLWTVGGGILLTSIVLTVGERMKAKKHKTRVSTWLLGTAVVLVLGLILFNTITLVRLQSAQPSAPPAPMMGQALTRMQFTEYDKNMAHEMMDENGDGMCDTCGMPIDQCMASGMMQCSMASDAKIGLLGSSHHHVDWKIYIDGKNIDLLPYAVPNKNLSRTSMFVHVEAGDGPGEKIGDVMHVHATGISLRFWFQSVGWQPHTMEGNDCLVFEDTMHCTSTDKSWKVYVNDKVSPEGLDYMPTDGDQILISYGPNNEDVSKQLALVTTFARTHYTKTN